MKWLNDQLWKLIHTHIWSGRRDISRPGWFIAFVKYDQRKAGKS